MHPAHKKRNIVIGSIIAVVMIVVGFAAWRMTQPAEDSQSYVPESLSSELLFSPYVPTYLPQGYKVDVSSYSVDDQALLFTAVDGNKQRSITFSEQAMPKDFDINSFHKTNITDASRIDGSKYPVIFGQITGQQGKIASVTTDGTWTLITLPQTTTKDDVSTIVSGLVRQ